MTIHDVIIIAINFVPFAAFSFITIQSNKLVFCSDLIKYFILFFYKKLIPKEYSIINFTQGPTCAEYHHLPKTKTKNNQVK